MASLKEQALVAQGEDVPCWGWYNKTVSKLSGQEAGSPFGGRELLQKRRAAWERYARWAAMQKSSLSPSVAIASVGFLYQLLPPESRSRPLEYEGVAVMHRLLSVLERR